jgi:hypothetical protein
MISSAVLSAGPIGLQFQRLTLQKLAGIQIFEVTNQSGQPDLNFEDLP